MVDAANLIWLQHFLLLLLLGGSSAHANSMGRQISFVEKHGLKSALANKALAPSRIAKTCYFYFNFK